MTEQTFAALFEESTKSRELREGAQLLVQVIRVGEDYVFVNAGLKSESRIPVEEFLTDNGGLEVGGGDFIEVEIDLLENGLGETVLSRANIRRKQAWEKIETAERDQTTVDGLIKERVKGGFSVLLEGVRAFLPGSLVDIVAVKDPTALLGTRQEFKIINIAKRRNSVVVSRSAVIEQALLNGGGESYKQYEEGARVRGKVHGVTDFGAFVDIGSGVYGLLHVSDLSWRRRKVADVLAVGDEVEVVVLKVDTEKKRVSLGMKQLKPDPWKDFERRQPVGSRMFGRVFHITEYGAFVETEEGVEGLVHSSEMDWASKNVNPSKTVQVNDEVEVMVLAINSERRRLSLGMKQCRSNPWKEFATAYPKNARIKGKVRSVTEFGVFLELPGGIDGLAHISDLSYDVAGEEAIRAYERGREVDAVVLAVDVERERIRLGVKQIGDEAFEAFADAHLKNTLVEGEVLSIDDKSAKIQLAPLVLGLLPAHEISEQKVGEVGAHIAVGQKVELMIVNIDRNTHRVILSLKARARARRETASAPANSLGALVMAKLEESAQATFAPTPESEAEADEAAPSAEEAEEADATSGEQLADDSESPRPAAGE